jgi:hypothetical protein
MLVVGALKIVGDLRLGGSVTETNVLLFVAWNTFWGALRPPSTNYAIKED